MAEQPTTTRPAPKRSTPLLLTASEAFRNEWEALDLLAGAGLVLRVPRVVDADVALQVLTVEEIEGRRFSVERPTVLDRCALTRAIVAAQTIGRCLPPDTALATLPVTDHLRGHFATGLLSARAMLTIATALAAAPVSWGFAHGAFSAGVMVDQATGALAVTDWRQAGIYPTGWDLAYLWFTTRAVPAARDAIEAAVGGGRRSSFWLSALLIVLDHVDEAQNSPGPNRYLEDDRDDLTDVVSQLAIIAATGSVGWT